MKKITKFLWNPKWDMFHKVKIAAAYFLLMWVVLILALSTVSGQTTIQYEGQSFPVQVYRGMWYTQYVVSTSKFTASMTNIPKDQGMVFIDSTDAHTGRHTNPSKLEWDPSLGIPSYAFLNEALTPKAANH